MNTTKDKLTGYQYLMSFILGIGYTGTCGLAYIASSYYALFSGATGFSDAQMGTMLSALGVCNMLSVLLGGPLADLVSPKRCLQFAYFVNPVIAMLVMFNLPGYGVMFACCCALSLCCQLPKWCPMCKLISVSGTSGQQGRLFSWYACFAAIGTLLVSVVGSAIVASFNAQMGFKVMIAMYSGILVVAGVLLTIFVKVPEEKLSKSNEFKVGDVLAIFKTPRLLLSFVAAAGIYITFFALNYINPMLGDVFGVPLATLTILVTLTGGGLNAIVSPIIGSLADKIGSTLKIFGVLYMVAIGACLMLTIIPWNPSMLVVAIILLFVVAICQHSSYAIFPTILTEVKAPENTLGTSTGLMSTVLTIPDMFAYGMAGVMLTNMGNNGYRGILWFACGFMILGFTCTLALLRMKKKGAFEQAA